MLPIIRQLEEKNVANEIDILLWSDRMDLVAFSNVKGEVALHRLTWTRAWSLGPRKDGDRVKAMAWRPDGKVLAIGYNTGHILLVNVEDKNTLHTIEIPGGITCITWIQERQENRNGKKLLVEEKDHRNYTQYVDYSSVFLSDAPSLSSYSTTNTPDTSQATNFFHKQSDLNLLLVGTSEGFVHFNVFGIFPCAVIDLGRHLETRCGVIDIRPSESLSRTFTTVEDVDGRVRAVVLDTSVFETHKKELFCMALKYQQTRSLLSYLSGTLSTIKETWESILLEMDSKLNRYASKTPPGTLSADFLDLLMFGISSEEMQEFLLHDLTKKGLEKFGQTIEMSYANMQKLLLKNVTKVGQNVTYHLAELRGMARLEDRYQRLGLDESRVSEAISANGSFLIKSGEMQQIINNSMLNYKAFFRWLYTAIIHLMYETVPPEIPKMTQQDLAYITEFLQNFDDIDGRAETVVEEGGGQRKTGFIMERLGQYLADSPLTILPNMELNEWDAFLSQNDCVLSHPAVLVHHKEMSLVQEYKHLEAKLLGVFVRPQKLIGDEMRPLNDIPLVTVCDSCPKTDCVNTATGSLLYAFLAAPSPSDGFYVVEFDHSRDELSARAAFVYVSHYKTRPEAGLGDKLLVTDVKFYTENHLSALLQEGGTTRNAVLFQCPVVALREKLQPVDLDTEIAKQMVARVDAADLSQTIAKNVSMPARAFAVSGSRRVSIVLGENGKKVMLFEMEGEEEEEEDADMTNSTVRESDTSMQENSDAE